MVRRLLPILVDVMVVVAGAWIGVIAFGFGYLWWMTSGPIPPLAEGLSDTIAVAEGEFRERVGAKFPIGSSEDDLVRELRSQGFIVLNESASFTKPNIVCANEWTIRWTALRGKLQTIEGRFSATCL